MIRVLLAFAATACLLCGCTGNAEDPQDGRNGGPAPSRRLLILSLDGLPWDMAQKRMAAGHMPHLAALVARGCSANGSLACFPAKTAPAYASLWTGAEPARHGILGNETPVYPRSQGSVLEARPGFDAQALRAEPLWRSAALSGKRVTIVQSTHAEPDNPDDRGIEGLTIFNGFRGLVKSAIVSGGAFAVDGKTFLVERSGAGLRVSSGAVRVEVPPGETVAVDHPAVSGVFYVRIGRIDDTGWDLFRSGYNPIVAPSMADAARFRANVGGFANNAQRLEPPLMDGTPWKRELYLAATRLNIDQVRKAVVWALKEFPSEVTIAYVPQPDEALHLLLGRAELWKEAEAQQTIDEVLEICDGLIGDLVAALGPEGSIALISDHGFLPVDKAFYPNLALERAGLLARDSKGQIDLSKTQVVYSRCGDFVVVNTRDRFSGIVETRERDAWLDLAERAIMAAADAELGKGALLPPVRPGAPDAQGVSPEGDSWFAAATVDGRLTTLLLPDLPPKDARATRSIPPMGWHSGDPREPRLSAVMVLAGPEFRHAQLDGVRLIDFAATLCTWLDIPPPAQSQGRSLEAFVEKK